jgi:hypothetical protein
VSPRRRRDRSGAKSAARTRRTAILHGSGETSDVVLAESRLSSTSTLHVTAGANRAAVGKDGQMMRGARNGRNSATELTERVRRGKVNRVTIETNGVLLKWGKKVFSY